MSDEQQDTTPTTDATDASVEGEASADANVAGAEVGVEGKVCLSTETAC